MSNMYDILGKLKNVMGLDEKPVETKTEPVYESVEARGDIMEAVKSLEEKYMGFKKTVAAVKKGGSAEDPEAVAAAIGRKKYGKKKFQKAAAAGKKLGEAAKPDFLDVDKDGDKEESFKKAVKDKKQVKEGQGPYELYNPKHPKFKANYDKWIAKNPGKKLADFIEAMKAREAKMNEAAYDEPAAPDAAAIERRKRLQALKDKREEEGHSDDAVNTPIRKVAGKAYGGAAQKDDAEKDDLEEAVPVPRKVMDPNKAPSAPGKVEQPAGHIPGTSIPHPPRRVSEEDLDEVAPPGAKAERMVKHIKKGYAKDGKLTKREKGIAYATAWKAHNKGQVEESDKKEFASTYKKFDDKVKTQQQKEKSKVGEGTEFGDKIANSKAELKKAKPAMVKESRVMEETDYFYEKIGKALAEMNPTLDTASSEFNTATLKAMVAHGIPPNRARNIMMMDDDFLSDVADSYHHACQEIAECGAPINSFVEESPMAELDEIAKLAGLPTKEAVYTETTDDERKLERYHELIKQGMDPDDAEVMAFNDEDDDEVDEDAMGAVMGGIAGGMVGKTPAAVATGAKLGSAARDTFNSATGLEEEEMEEGNEFSGALAAAKASGAKEFEVDGKTYTVKEDTSVNDIRRLSGLAETEEVVEEDEELAEERDIEYVNTPREKTAPLSAAIPSGTDLHKSKMQDPETANKAANPLTRKAKQVEESLWKSYEDMINDVKAK